jgi:hypothetical protein
MSELGVAVVHIIVDRLQGARFGDEQQYPLMSSPNGLQKKPP